RVHRAGDCLNSVIDSSLGECALGARRIVTLREAALAVRLDYEVRLAEDEALAGIFLILHLNFEWRLTLRMFQQRLRPLGCTFCDDGNRWGVAGLVAEGDSET